MSGCRWHLVTPEYPPELGGVADHTRTIAEGLAASGDHVHVWTGAGEGAPAGSVDVHRTLGDFGRDDLRASGAALDGFPGPRTLIVQWVPHGYGRRSLNVGFCAWVLARARVHGDRVFVVVHEPGFAFGEGDWRRQAGAAAHRAMLTMLMAAATRVWVTTTAWTPIVKAWAVGRDLGFDWLPVPASIVPVDDPASVSRVRAAVTGGQGQVIGHFGTFGDLVAAPLRAALDRLIVRRDLSVLLIGRGSEAFRAAWAADRPEVARRVTATGALPSRDVSVHLQACDLLVQPYPDGVSGRRTTAVTGLAHGLPIVTTSGRFTESAWADRGAVRLAPTGDAAALAATTVELLDDAAARQRLRGAALRVHGDLFSAGAVLRALRAAAGAEPGSHATGDRHPVAR